MSVVVLASFLPGEGYFRSQRFRVVGIPCQADTDYCEGVQRFWETDQTLIVVEHDHDPTDDQIQELLDCPHDLCTWAYVLHHASTGGAAHYAQRDGGTGYGEWVEPGVEWCGFTGIGFCKIAPQARVRPLEASSWQEVDCRIFDATDGLWHTHWLRNDAGEPIGVPHHHV